MKTIPIPLDHKLILFDVKLLFTNVLLDFTIDLISKHIHNNVIRQCITNIKKKEMKLLLLCKKMCISVTMV